MMGPRIEPKSLRPLANTLPTRPMKLIHSYLPCQPDLKYSDCIHPREITPRPKSGVLGRT